MFAQMSRAHPKVSSMLALAERRTDVITEHVEPEVSVSGPEVVGLSGAIFDILMESTGQPLFGKGPMEGRVGRGAAIATKTWAEGVWVGKWHTEQKEAWMKAHL